MGSGIRKGEGLSPLSYVILPTFKLNQIQTSVPEKKPYAPCERRSSVRTKRGRLAEIVEPRVGAGRERGGGPTLGPSAAVL